MSTAVPPMPSETAPAGLSESQRIINTFAAPTKTFTDIRRNASWWMPFVLLTVTSLLLGFTKFQKLDPVHLVQQRIELSSRAQRQMEQLSPSQREASIALQAKVARISFFAGPIGYLLGALLIAAVFMAVFNFGFAAEIPFQRYLSIAFYAFLPVVLSNILMVVALSLNSDPDSFNQFNPIATNPAYFMDIGEHRLLYGIAASLDLFSIWVVTLIGLGIAANSAKGKVSAGSALITMYVLYGLLILGGTAVASAF